MRLGLFYKLFFFITLTVVAIGAALSLVFYYKTRAIVMSELEERGRVLTRSLAALSARGVETRNVFHTLEPLIKGVAQQRDVAYVHIVDGEGEILASSELPSARRLEDEATRRALLAVGAPLSSLAGEILEIGLAIERPAAAPGDEDDLAAPAPAGGAFGAVRLGLSLASYRDQLRGILLLGGGLLGALSALALFVGFTLSRWIAGRVQLVAEAARRIGRGDLGARVPVRSHDELGDLAQGFNKMTEELAAARTQLEKRVSERTRELEDTLQSLVQTQDKLVNATKKVVAAGQMTSSAAREIRIPLAVILRASQEIEQRLPKGDPLRLTITVVLREADRCQGLVQKLASLADATALTKKEIDIRELESAFDPAPAPAAK
jgi:methyl-accepting chemotaxis protein